MALAFKTGTPPASQRRACFKKIPFIYSPAEFTLCSPPSETVSRSAMRYTPQFSSLPGFPPLFPLFLSQHDMVINKQLKKRQHGTGHCLLSSSVCLAFAGIWCRDETTGVCLGLYSHIVWHTATTTNKNTAQRSLKLKYLTFIKAHRTVFSFCICGYRYDIGAYLLTLLWYLPFSWHLKQLTMQVPWITFKAPAYDQS